MSQGPPGGAPGDRPPGRVSLLGSGGQDPSRRPEADSDAPLRSEHSRHHELAAPTDDYDESRSIAVCAEIVREALRDLAPALILLSPDEARRTRILLAWTRTLFDFTDDRSLEGERLSQLNRWQFSTEESLDGNPPGQPIFVMIADEERRAPWSRSTLDSLASTARRRISKRSWTLSDRRAEAQALVRTVLADARPAEIDEASHELLVDLLLAWQLFRKPADLAFRRPELADREAATGDIDRNELDRHIEELNQRLRSVTPAPATAQRRRALRFARRAALDLLQQVRGGKTEPRIGLAKRLRFLVAARLGAG